VLTLQENATVYLAVCWPSVFLKNGHILVSLLQWLHEDLLKYVEIGSPSHCPSVQVLTLESPFDFVRNVGVRMSRMGTHFITGVIRLLVNECPPVIN